jgi:putative ABC transport system permease protein
MGLIVPPAAAIIPVFLGTRVTILEAMTDLGISVDYGRGPLAWLLKVLPLPINVRQALSNVTRKKGRLVLTWLTLALAAGVFMGVFGPFYSLDQRLAAIWETFNYQIFVAPTAGQDFERIQTVLTSDVPAVKAAYPAASLLFQVEGYVDPQTQASAVQVLGFDTRSDAIRLDLSEGTGWQADPDREGIVLSSAVSKQLEKTVGDRLVYTLAGRPAEMEIIGITDLELGFGFMNWRALAEMGESVLGEPLPIGLAAQMTTADAETDEVDEVIDQMEETLGAQGITADFQNFVFFRDSVSQGINLFRYIFLVVVLEMAAVGAIGLLATLSMAVFERQKEIGVMRSIGAGSWTIAGQFLVEGNLIGILAWLVGIPVASGVAPFLVSQMGFDLDPLPPITLLVGLVGMIVIATISSLWPSLNAARKTVSEIIRYQ